MAAAQVQPPDLVDDEGSQRRILRMQEPVVGLEVLKGQVVVPVTAAVIRVTRVRVSQ